MKMAANSSTQAFRWDFSAFLFFPGEFCVVLKPREAERAKCAPPVSQCATRGFPSGCVEVGHHSTEIVPGDCSAGIPRHITEASAVRKSCLRDGLHTRGGGHSECQTIGGGPHERWPSWMNHPVHSSTLDSGSGFLEQSLSQGGSLICLMPLARRLSSRVVIIT